MFVVVTLSSRLRPLVASLGRLLKLRGPLSGDPTARILHTLLLGVLIWDGLTMWPSFSPWRPANLIAAVTLALIAGAALVLLSRGSLRKSALVYLAGIWLTFSVAIVLNGGIRSPGISMYVALPISAAWLFGYRGAFWVSAGCIGCVFVLALLEAAGVKPILIFPGRPFGIVATLVGAILIAAVPAAQVMRNLQEALRQSDASLRLAVEAAGVGMFDYYPQTGKLVFSNITKTYFGMAPQTDIDHDMFLAAVHPEDREHVRQTGLALTMPGTDGQLAIEYRSVGVEDGRERWLGVRGRMLFDPDNRATRMIGTVLDISVRKRLEEQLRQRAETLEKLMEVAPVALLVANDPECREISGNPAGNEMFEAEQGANLSLTQKGGSYPDLQFFRGGRAVLPKELPLQVAVAAGIEVRDWEAEAIMPSGARKFIWGGATPLRDAAGRVRGAVGAYQDITSMRQRAEATLRTSEERLRTMTLFLANVSHELRTPLGAILGFSWLLRREESLSDKHAEALDMISRSGSHLLTLINDTLDIARIETGHESLQITTVNVIELVREVMDMMHVPAQQKNLELSSAWIVPAARLIRIDGPKLRQILVNLLGNAIKYTDTGSVTLRVEMARVADAGKLRLRIEVQDTGVGIAPEEQAHVFEPFVQLSRTNTRKGSGLGLAICRETAHIMGGAIEVTSSPGMGSTFRVELPVEIAEESGFGDVSEIDSRVVAPDQPQFRILLIEDDKANRLLLMRLLEGAGFQVRTAADTETGMGVCSEWRPHFVWLDLRLHGTIGVDAIARIRALPDGRDMKIAVLTTGVFDEQRDAFLVAGADDFVRRPWSPRIIFECMERLLGVKYVHSAPPARSVTGPYDLTGIDRLPENLKSTLLNALLLLDKERIVRAIHSISSIDPALGGQLTRHAEALEFTAILHAVQPGRRFEEHA